MSGGFFGEKTVVSVITGVFSARLVQTTVLHDPTPPMNNFVYDYAIVGGGCAGFQLLYQLAQQPGWATRRVLLLTDDQRLHRSWCFWSRDPNPPFHALIQHSWASLRVRGAGFSRTAAIAPYQYHYLSGDAFFRYFNDVFLPMHVNITRIVTTVDSITRPSTDFMLTGSGETWRAHQVFSSRLPPMSPSPRFRLWQHFSGWFVKTDRPVFDAQTVTLMDFTVPQQRGAVQFGYILPFSATNALIEITIFSAAAYSDQHYTDLLTDYMYTNFPGTSFTIEMTEQGQIPMTDFPFSRYGPAGEVLLGTAAGLVKATTGYAFRRIGLDSAQLARHLAANSPTDQHPIGWPATRGRFRFYDRLLLGIMAEQPTVGVIVLSTLFRHGSFPAILCFLDEESGLLTDIGLISRLPYTPFLTQLVRQWLR